METQRTTGLLMQQNGQYTPATVGSPESEKYIISACLAVPDAIYQAQDYISSPYVFSVGLNATIWRAFEALLTESNPIDPHSVAGKIKKMGGPDISTELIDIAFNTLGTANLVYHCQTVVEGFIARQASAKAKTLIEIARNPNADVFEAIDKCQAELEELTTNLIQGRPVKAGDISESRIEIARDRVRRRAEAEAKGEDFTDGIPSGIPDLDRILNGFLDGRFYVFAARPGMGKSAICMNNVAFESAMKGHASLYKSLEMPKEELVDRVLCAVSGVDYTVYQKGLMNEAGFNLLGAAQTEIGGLPIYIEDQGGDSILKIRAGVRKYRREFGLKMLIVDNLSLIKETGFNRENEMARISGGLKRLAIEMDIPVIGISHLSRKVQDRNIKIPISSDLRDSGAIEQDADGIIMLYRPGYKEYGMEYARRAHQELWDSLIVNRFDPEQIFSELALLDVVKNRGLTTGDCWTRFIGKHTKFECWQDPALRELLGLKEFAVKKPKPKEPLDDIVNEFDGFPF